MNKTAKWHPRGEPTWPDWKKAKPGQRVEHVRSGDRATFVAVSRHRNNGAIVEWDPTHAWQASPVRAYVIAPAFDLRPVEQDA
jgi:hypothetical protein